jgi:hypothetical protein
MSQLAWSASQILEIGIIEGSTINMLIANALANAHKQAIDPFLAGLIGISWGKFIADREITHTRRSSPSLKVNIHRNVSPNVTITVEFGGSIFVHGDHSLGRITQDWADWSGKVAVGGCIALHDSLVPSYNPYVANLGGSQYYASHISKDDCFQLVK